MTIDVKTLFIILVFIALIILIVYAIFLLRKLLVTLEHANKVLADVEVVSEIAANRSQDLDGIIDNVSSAASNLSESMNEPSFMATVSNVAKVATSIKGIVSSGSDDLETRAAKKQEKKSRRDKRSSRK